LAIGIGLGICATLEPVFLWDVSASTVQSLSMFLSLICLILTGISLIYYGFRATPLSGITIVSLFALFNSAKLFQIVWFQNGNSEWVWGAYKEAAMVGFVYLIGWIALVLGYSLFREKKEKWRKASSFGRTPILSYEPVPHSAYLVLFFFVGLGVYLWVVSSVGGVAYTLVNAQQRQLLFEGKHYILLFTRLMYISALILLAKGLRKGLRSSQTLLGMAMLLIGFVAFATLGGRSQALAPLIMGLLLINVYKPIGLLLASGLGVTFGLFVLVGGAFRVSGGEISDLKVSINSVLDEFLDTDGFILMLNLIHQGLFSYQWGMSYMALITNIIPRAFWPDKPATLDLLVSQAHNPLSWSGKTVTVFGELYANFLIPGVILGGLLWGYTLRLLERKVYTTSSLWLQIILVIAITRLSAPGPQSTQPFVFLEDMIMLSLIAGPVFLRYLASRRASLRSIEFNQYG